MACGTTPIALLFPYHILIFYSYFTDELVVTNKTDVSFRAPDETIWVDVTYHSQDVTGRMPSHNVLTSRFDSTSYAKKKVVEGSLISAFTLFMDNFMICEIISFTETEARSKLKKN